MILARSLIFAALFYLWSTVLAIIMLPLLLAPRRWMLAMATFWAAGVRALLAPVCGVRVEFRGLEHLPTGAALIAGKHNCMFDTMGPLLVLTDACYVMRKELTRIPVYGAFTMKAGTIVVDREGGAGALRKLVADAREAISERRQVFIFPEGSRMAPGETGAYKPGIAALYRDLGMACTPMATNSGAHWPAHGFIRRPGLIVYEFLPPIPEGMHRAEFMRTLKERIEPASLALLKE
jgi:1-acyl-sn-glycerol-3-phosphate acyltransferase